MTLFGGSNRVGNRQYKSFSIFICIIVYMHVTMMSGCYFVPLAAEARLLPSGPGAPGTEECGSATHQGPPGVHEADSCQRQGAVGTQEETS